MKKLFILLLWFAVASQIPPQYNLEKSATFGVNYIF